MEKERNMILLNWMKEKGLLRLPSFAYSAGGTFALYSLQCRHARLSILSSQQETDEKLSAYAIEGSAHSWQSSALESFLEKYPVLHKGLLIFVLLGTCMAIGDSVFTPAVSGSSTYSKLYKLYTFCILLKMLHL